MKKTLAALSISATLALTTTVHAGGMAEPVMVMEPDTMIADAGGSSSGVLVPLILIALITVALSGSGSGAMEVDEVSELASDARAKTDIVRVGTAANGLPLYHFRYIGGEPVFEGVMAQDVLMHTAEAVSTDASGLMRVNYGMLGIQMKIVN